MPPPPPMARPPAPSTLTSAFVKGDNLSSVPSVSTGLSRQLPSDWRAIPSKSRPGETSYVHTPTGLKQARFPTEDPTPAQIAQHHEAVRAAKEKKRNGGGRTAKPPLLKNAATANWQRYCKRKK